MTIYKPDGGKIVKSIMEDLSIAAGPVKNTVELLVGGATVPFIARYRKEKTGGLNEIKIREVKEKLGYYSELEQRKETVLNTIDSQGKLSPHAQGHCSQ